MAIPEEQRELTFLEALGRNVAPQEDSFLPEPLEIIFNLFDVPQDVLTAAVPTGNEETFLERFARGQDPSEFLPEGTPGFAKFLFDVAADPLNITGFSAFTRARGALKGIDAAESAGRALFDEAATAPLTAIGKEALKKDFRDAGFNIKLSPDGVGVDIPFVKSEIHKSFGDTFIDAAEKGGFEVLDTGVKPLYTQMIEAVNRGDISFKKDILKPLADKGIPEKIAIQQVLGNFDIGIETAAKVLNQQSQFAKRIKRLAKDNPGLQKAIDDMDDIAGGVDPDALFGNLWKRIDNTRRGLLVTQMSTAIRNATSQAGRVGLDVLQQGMDAAIQKVFGLPQRAHPGDAMEVVGNIFHQLKAGKIGQTFKATLDPTKDKSVAGQILKKFPKEWDRLVGNFASDITAVGAKGSKSERLAVDMLNTPNRFQEFVIRRAVFQAKLQASLRNKGIDLTKAIEAGDFSKVAKDDIKKAVDASLRFTFAESPEFGSLGQKFVSFINALPGATLAIPFPRFLVNSMKFFTDFSPTGFLKLLGKKEWQRVLKGDVSTISKATLGAGMLGAAWEVRNSEHAGERWYELNAGGKNIDLRAYNPFAAYLFVADVIKRGTEGRLNTLTGKDMVMGVLGSNLRAGTGLFLVDQVLQGVTGFKDPEAAAQKIKEFAGEAIGGFFTPLNQIKDIVAEFDESQAVVRDVRAEPLLGPTLARIPFADVNLPEVESPTQADPLVRESTALRQLTGLTFRQEKNAAQKELDRLGFSRREIQPFTGNSTADRLIAKNLGPLVEEVIAPLVNDPGYADLGDGQKGEVIRQALIRLRSAARRRARGENPGLFRKLNINKLPKRKKRALKELGVL